MSNINFGTGGFRGVIGDNFTKENVQKICQAMCIYAENNDLKKQICIGYDNRFMSEIFARWCAEVFLANGFFVEICDSSVATPVVMFESKLSHNDLGLMITASHNPFMYNGMKVLTKDGREADVLMTTKLKEIFENIKEVKTTNLNDSKRLKYISKVEEFVKSIIKNQNIPFCSDIKVVFDAKNGSASKELKIFADMIGLKNYIILNSNRDALFGGKMPCPSEDNVEDLKGAMKEINADIGFALDADGDRLAVIDKNGNYVSNNYILSLVYYYFCKYENKCGGIVKSVATSCLCDKVAEKFGNKCYEVPVGFKFTSLKLIETKSIVGGESSGGLAVSNHIWGKDSLLSIALCLKIMIALNKPFDKIVEELTNFASYKKVFVEKQYSYKKENEEKLKKLLFIDKTLPKIDLKIEKVSFDDGVKYYLENQNWILVRFSGTEPLIRIYVESDSKKQNEQLFKVMEKMLKLG